MFFTGFSNILQGNLFYKVRQVWNNKKDLRVLKELGGLLFHKRLLVIRRASSNPVRDNLNLGGSKLRTTFGHFLVGNQFYQ